MAQDELTEIPSFAARRDEAVDSAPRNAIPSRGRETAGISRQVNLHWCFLLSRFVFCRLMPGIAINSSLN